MQDQHGQGPDLRPDQLSGSPTSNLAGSEGQRRSSPERPVEHEDSDRPFDGGRGRTIDAGHASSLSLPLIVEHGGFSGGRSSSLSPEKKNNCR